RLLRYALPVVAALALVMGISALSAKAQESKDSKDAKTGKGKIAGTVTDKDGKAVEGVEVRLMKPRQRGGGGGGGASPTRRAARAVGTNSASSWSASHDAPARRTPSTWGVLR